MYFRVNVKLHHVGDSDGEVEEGVEGEGEGIHLQFCAVHVFLKLL